ncbi:MAG: TetR/AcrR family transcriptional regulator [Clostridia bacterium]|nr:TetR/AcrR family transcriptional regulator [Clostridia bacterium]
MVHSIFHRPVFDRIPKEKQLRILSTAINEFATYGFDNANINVIAKKAEVSVGSLYKYFSTKTDLFLTAVHSGVSTLEQVIEAVNASDDDVMNKLEKLIRTAIDFSRKQQTLIKLYNCITSETNSALVEKLVYETEHAAAQAYTEAVIHGQESGEIRQDIDPRIAAFLVDNLIMSVQFSFACDYYSQRLKLYTDSEILEHDEILINNTLKFIKAALYPRKEG